MLGIYVATGTKSHTQTILHWVQMWFGNEIMLDGGA